MSAHDPGRGVDDLLREGGGEIGGLYRRLPRYDPPRRLDRAVLGEAARAVHSGRPPRRQRWILGVGSAAGIVLAAGIAWRIGHDAMDRTEAGSTTSAPRVVPVQPISESSRAKNEAPAQPAEENAAKLSEPSAEDTAANQAAHDELKSVVRKTKAASGKPAPPPPASPRLQAAKPAPAASAPEAFPAAGERQRGAAKDLEKSREADAASAAGGANVYKRADKQSSVGGLASPTPPSGSVELQRDMQLAPDDWLAHVRELLRQGREQQAAESLRLFRRSHPDREIPDDLKALLE
ncbi:MAG TPA: hypothetical protein VH375_11460 [Rhodanobacteraceae bacterium]